ncbi:MAG: anti-sigma factor [Nitrospiraceae bacterium]
MTGLRSAHSHRHSKAQCLKILRSLSAYLDNELTSDVCREIRLHLGACPNCEIFLTSLRRTVDLCRHAHSKPLSSRLRAQFRRQIFRAVGRS